MSLLVIAYPHLHAGDLELIQCCRKVNDAYYYSVVEPHFTIVFPVTDFIKEAFSREIEEKVKGIKKINFCIKCAIVSKNDFNEYFHTFLVPDEGANQIIQLHDQLYSGLLKDELRIDIDYIPHITIATSGNEKRCMEVADDWNQKNLTLTGYISHLSIADFTDSKIAHLQEIELI